MDDNNNFWKDFMVQLFVLIILSCYFGGIVVIITAILARLLPGW